MALLQPTVRCRVSKFVHKFAFEDILTLFTQILHTFRKLSCGAVKVTSMLNVINERTALMRQLMRSLIPKMAIMTWNFLLIVDVRQNFKMLQEIFQWCFKKILFVYFSLILSATVNDKPHSIMHQPYLHISLIIQHTLGIGKKIEWNWMWNGEKCWNESKQYRQMAKLLADKQIAYICSGYALKWREGRGNYWWKLTALYKNPKWISFVE